MPPELWEVLVRDAENDEAEAAVVAQLHATLAAKLTALDAGEPDEVCVHTFTSSRVDVSAPLFLHRQDSWFGFSPSSSFSRGCRLPLRRPA